MRRHDPSPHGKKYRVRAESARYAAAGESVELLVSSPTGGDINAGPPGAYIVTGAALELVCVVRPPASNVNAGPPGKYTLVGAAMRAMRTFGPVPRGAYTLAGVPAQLVRKTGQGTITNVNGGPPGRYSVQGARSLAIAE